MWSFNLRYDRKYNEGVIYRICRWDHACRQSQQICDPKVYDGVGVERTIWLVPNFKEASYLGINKINQGIKIWKQLEPLLTSDKTWSHSEMNPNEMKNAAPSYAPWLIDPENS